MLLGQGELSDMEVSEKRNKYRCGCGFFRLSMYIGKRRDITGEERPQGKRRAQERS